MKIAYLFHGHSRTWRDCYESFFDNVFSEAPGDIYIHTWDRINSKYGSWWNGTFGELDINKEKISSQTVDIDLIKKKYNPKYMTVETDLGNDYVVKHIPEISKTSASPAHIGVYNMCRAQRKVFEMADYCDSYDIYFSLRLDMFFLNKFDNSELNDFEHMMYPYSRFNTSTQIVDVYAFGTKTNMEIRSKFVNYIWEYWYSKNSFNTFSIEHAATKYYKDNNIKLKQSQLNVEMKRLF